MIYLDVKPRRSKAKTITWSLDSEESFPSVKIEEVQILQADQKELEIIRKEFSNIPMTPNEPQIWVGEWARQIFANLATAIDSCQEGNNIVEGGKGLMEDS